MYRRSANMMGTRLSVGQDAARVAAQQSVHGVFANQCEDLLLHCDRQRHGCEGGGREVEPCESGGRLSLAPCAPGAVARRTRLGGLLVADGVEGEGLARTGERAGVGGRLQALSVALPLCPRARLSASAERTPRERSARTLASSRSLGGRTRTTTEMFWETSARSAASAACRLASMAAWTQ